MDDISWYPQWWSLRAFLILFGLPVFLIGEARRRKWEIPLFLALAFFPFSWCLAYIEGMDRFWWLEAANNLLLLEIFFLFFAANRKKNLGSYTLVAFVITTLPLYLNYLYWDILSLSWISSMSPFGWIWHDPLEMGSFSFLMFPILYRFIIVSFVEK